MKFRESLIFSLTIASILALFFIEIYPVFFNDNYFNNKHLSDVTANFFGLFPLNFLFLLISKKHGISQIFLMPPAIALGFIIYEFIQLYIPWQTFDKLDIYASLVAMLVCIPINLIILSLSRKKS
jgi:hypothetical protein